MKKNSESLPGRFRRFVEKERLFGSEDLVLLAVSGGLDSTVMAHLFHIEGYRFGIAHCNFGLRGAASDGDEAFVARLAADLGAPFFCRRLDAAGYADARGMSVQMAARELRYAWFAELCAEEGYACIATAHHANDSAETVLLNLARGAGPEGWAGIGAERAGVRRPLLFADRSEIEAFAREQGFEWREDSSNAEDYYARNYLRRHIWPHFEHLNPAFLRVMMRNQNRIRQYNANYRALLLAHFDLSEPPHWPMRLAAHALASIPSPEAALDALLAPYGFNAEQIRQMAGARDTGMWESAQGYRAEYNRGDLTLSPTVEAAPAFRVGIARDDIMLRLPDGGRVFQTPHPPGEPWPDGKEAISVPLDRLVYPLALRPREPGDVFRPFGMGGQTQKVKDLLINLRLGRLEKERVRILENGDGAIIWVVGYRMDERFRVQAGDDPVVKITIKAD